ncbi:EscU/YscU/HrcU family type III secretion system export apparatus switch protein [Thiohalospira sp.]|uniref:EscU/YscU/HrcU family type III secretion system export apparatus switch protein n=1 Tax=Thiohalospira sp. TaxID=3080549 RepID=UPI00397EA39F
MADDRENEEGQRPPRAVALRYDGQSAPRVTAKGAGETAEAILRLAEENGIPLHEDPDLVTLLAQLELGQEIPTNLYQAVAEVIAFAYLMSGKEPPLPGHSGEPEEPEG